MKFNKIITTIMLVVSLMILFGVLIACTDAEASNDILEFDDNSTFELISSDNINAPGYTFKLCVIQDKDTKVQYAITIPFSSSGSVIMTPLYNKDGSLKTFLN